MQVLLKLYIILVCSHIVRYSNENLLFFSVLTLMKSNQYQRVKDFLHKYTIIQPSNAQVFCLMAEALQQTNDTEQAKSWLVKKKEI